MADVQANIGINIDASGALAQLKNLQRQISVFNAQIAKGSANAASAASRMQQELVNSINATGQFSASMTTVKSTTDTFTNALEKNKLSMGQYFRYAGASSKKFSHLFTNEFNTIEKVARERVKTLQTQYVKLGRDANGALKSIAVRPLSLDMGNLATQTAMAAQKQQIFNQLLRQGSTNLLNWGKNTQWAGRQLMVGFTIPLTIFGAAAASSFMKLEEQAIRFKRVYGELFTPPEETDRMLQDIQNLALEFTKYGVAVEKTMALAADAAAMGRTGADLTAQVTEANRLAVLGLVEQGQALETTTSLSNAFGVATEDLASKIDFLNAVENQTVTSIEDMTIAIPKAGPVVKQLGGDVEDLAFFLTAMKEGGINASEGANALKSGLASLINPTQVAKDMLAGFGINITQIVESNAGNVSGIVVDFATALDKLDPLNRARAIEQLFGKFQFSRISTLFQNVIGEGTQAQRVLELTSATTKELAALSSSELGKLEASSLYKFQSALAEFQAALAPVGEAFLKLVTPIIEFGTKVLNAFNNLNDGAKAFVVGIIATLGAIGPVLIMSVGLLANGAANLLKIFLGLQTGFQRILGKTTEVGQQTEYMTQEQLEAAAVAASLNQSHATLAQTFTSESAAVDKLVASYRAMIAAQRSSLGLPIAASVASAKVPGLNKGRGVPGYKDGVLMVPGTGNKDTELALLTPGEAVIPADKAKEYAPLINSMIAGNIPGYVDGRTVASHFAQETPPLLENVFKTLAESGRKLEKTIFIITKNADGLGYTMEKVRGYVDEFVEPGDTVVAGGRAYGGTAVPESDARNRLLYEDKDIKPKFENAEVAGSWQTVEELSKQAEILAEEKRKNTEAYQRNRSSIEEILLENEKAQQIINQSTNKEQAALSIQKEKAKAALVNSIQQENKNISADEAERLATEMLEDVQEQYAKRIQSGMSAEDSLREATLDLQRLRLAQGDSIVIGRSGVSSDTVRSIASSRGKVRDSVYNARKKANLPTGASDIFDRRFEGQGAPSGGRSAEQILSANKAVDPNYRIAGILVLEKAQKDLALQIAKAAKSQSPSKVTEQAAKNLVDGTVKGLREGQDDMQQAGSQLADAAETGVRSRRRGDPSRVQTAGPSTPGQPLNYSILNGQMLAAAATTAQFRDRLANAGLKAGNFAGKTVGAANKIGALGIGVSSLVGGFSMINGPLGEFSQKIFPIVSAMTALGFAMNMLNAEQVKQKIIEAGRRVVIAQEVAARLNNTRSMIAEAAVRNTAGISGILGNVGRTAGKLGTNLSVMGRAVGSVLGSLLGVSATVGLVVAGLALVAGGLYFLYKVAKEQEAKISGLGDAANISADKLGVLNTVLGTQLALNAQMGGRDAGLDTGTIEGDATAAGTQQQLQESDEFKKEFKGITSAVKGASQEAAEQALTSLALTLQTAGAEKEMIAGVVNAILAEAGRTDISLDFENISIANAPEVAKKSVEEFTNAIEASATAQRYTAPVAEEGAPGSLNNQEFDATLFGGKGGFVSGRGQTTNLASTMSPEALASLNAAGATLAATMQNATIAFDSGQISAAEYDTQMQSVSDTINNLATNGNLVQAAMLVNELANQLKEIPGMEDIQEKIAGLLGSGTETGISAATTVLQTEATGIEVTETEMATLEAGSKVGADPTTEIKAATDLTNKLNELTEARIKSDEAARAATTSQANVDAINEESEALGSQASSIRELNGFLKDNASVSNKAAVAQKIANDETALAAWQAAALADAQTGGTAERDAYIASIQAESAAQAEIDYEKAVLGLQAQAQAQADSKIQTEALGIALGDSQLAQAAMGDAAVATAIAALYAQETLNGATISAADFAAKVKASGIIELIQSLPSISKGTSGGGGGTPSSFLDGITKDLNQFVDSSVKIGQGFNSSLRSIQNFSRVGAESLRGLGGQLRDLGVSEPFIEKILGMDPKEWNRQKKKLFEFDSLGNPTKLTKAGQAIQDALNVAEIGKFINEQENITISVGHQITALTRLTDAGASYEAAYEAVKNTAFAAAIATATSSAQIQAAANAAMEAQKMMKKMEAINEEENRKKAIRDAVRDMNKEFSNQAKILDYINRNRSKLSEAQIGAILTNDDLTKLVLEPSIDPSALSTALANAERQAELDLSISKLTIEGTQGIFEEGFGQAMDAFGRQEQSIELKFKSTVANDEEVLRNAEEEIAKIQYEVDDYEAELERIAWKEEDINEAYDKRLEALDEVASANERITRAQQAQLDVADALSKGDIAAAAKAAQAMRSQQAKDAVEIQREQLEKSREAELANLKSGTGLGRQELEDKITALQRQIFEIEESSTEPAAERIRLAEVLRDSEVRSLEVLGKTREQWENIKSGIDMAQQSGYKFKEIMQEALSVVEQLMNAFPKEKPLPPPPPPPPPPAPRQESSGPELARKSEWTFGTGADVPKDMRGKTVEQVSQQKGYAQWQDYYNANRAIDHQIIPKIKKAYGGIIGRSRSGPPLQYLEGGKVVGPGTERSDSIPAWLSNGEYVIQASSVRRIGIDTLDMLNSGKVKPGYKDDLPAFKGGGIVKKQSTPVNIRQIERAAAPTPKAAPPKPPRLSQSFAPVTSKVTAVNIEKTGQNLASWFGSTAVGKAIGNAIGGTGVGSTIARGAIAALSTPVEMVGGLALGAVKSINEKSLAPLITGTTVGAANAWKGVLDPSKMSDSMFTQAGKYVADNKMFGAVDAEGQARARNIGNLLNIVGDPLTYLGIGAVTKVTKAATVARASNTSVSPSPGSGVIPGPSGNSVVSPKASEIRAQQKIVAEETARIIEEKVITGRASGTISGLANRLAIAKYKRDLVASDTNSFGPTMQNSDALDMIPHIKDLSPEELLAVAKNYANKGGELKGTFGFGAGQTVSPYAVRTSNMRTYAAYSNPIKNFLSSKGLLPDDPNTASLSALLDHISNASKDAPSADAAKILKDLALPQIGPKPKILIGGKNSTGAFVSGENRFAKQKNNIGSTAGVALARLFGNTSYGNMGPLSTFMSPRSIKDRSYNVLAHENVHIYDKMVDQLGLPFPAKYSSFSDFNYNASSFNASLEARARLIDSLYSGGRAKTYSPFTSIQQIIDNLFDPGMSKKDISKFLKTYAMGGRASQFNSDWFRQYAETIKSPDFQRIAPVHSAEELAGIEKMSKEMERAGLVGGLDRSQQGSAFSKLIWNQISRDGSFRPPGHILRKFAKVQEAAEKLSRKKAGLFERQGYAPPERRSQSSEFLKDTDLTEIDVPLDVYYTEGFFSDVSRFAENISGNKFFVKGHLTDGEYGPEIYQSFGHEFLAGRIGNMVGANTPQSYIVKRSSDKKPFEVATEAVPQSSGLDPTYMKELVTLSDNPYKTLDEIVSAFIDYSEKTPALNAAMGNYDQHYNNILWNNLDKKFTQIDFGTSHPTSLKMAPGIPGTHPDARDAYTLARTSIAIVRDAVHHSVNAAVEKQLLSQAQQLAIIGKLNNSGFNIKPNRTSGDPLFDTIPDITTNQDYSQVYRKISEFDSASQLPNSVQFLDKFALQTIKDRAFALSELAPVSFGPEHHSAMAKRLFREKGLGFMAGGYVNSINTDTIPAMLTAGEYVVKRSAVDKFGVSNLEKINNGTYNNGSVYNYNLAVNVKSDADPEKIARTVMQQVKRVDSQRVRGNRF